MEQDKEYENLKTRVTVTQQWVTKAETDEVIRLSP